MAHWRWRAPSWESLWGTNYGERPGADQDMRTWASLGQRHHRPSSAQNTCTAFDGVTVDADFGREREREHITRKSMSSCSPHVSKSYHRRSWRAPKLPHSCPNVVQHLSTSCLECPTSAAKVGRLGPPHVGRCGAMFASARPISAQVGRCGPSFGTRWQVWQTIDQTHRNDPGFVQVYKQVPIGHRWMMVCLNRPASAKMSPNTARLGRCLADAWLSGQSFSNLYNVSTPLGQLRSWLHRKG